MSPAPRNPKLAELDGKDRQALLAEAKAELMADKDARQDAAEQLAGARNDQLRALMDDRDHLRGCPADGRIEAYAEMKPAKPNKGEPAKPVTCVRCIECGGIAVLDRPYPEVVAEITAELTTA